MNKKQGLLIEIGTEELPPKSLKRLAPAFHREICNSLKENGLAFSEASWLATPRRLALIINQLDINQADKQQQRRGPAVSAAFDDDGKPTRATEGFAKSCGVAVDQLDNMKTEKGSWLVFDTLVKGKQTQELIPDMINTALKRLPIAKRMRWGNNDFEFVRPIKWILLLLGTESIDCEIMGVKSGKHSYGHRFHHPESINITHASNYVEILKQNGKVIADYNERCSLIKEQIEKVATENNGIAVIDPELLDEVTALVEWPISFVGNFNSDFLKLPKEVLIASMQDHQKYFPILDKQKKLLASFICVTNIESKQPDLIKQGNERVIQPRLSDAAFIWKREWYPQALRGSTGDYRQIQ